MIYKLRIKDLLLIPFHPSLKPLLKPINFLLRNFPLETDIDERNKINKMLEVF